MCHHVRAADAVHGTWRFCWPLPGSPLRLHASANVWFCISGWDSDIPVPGHWLASGPWDQCAAGRFTFWQNQICRFLCCQNLCPFHSCPQNIELCRCCLGELLRQESPWSTRATVCIDWLFTGADAWLACLSLQPSFWAPASQTAS